MLPEKNKWIRLSVVRKVNGEIELSMVDMLMNINLIQEVK